MSDLRSRNVLRFKQAGDEYGAGIVAEVLEILSKDEERRLEGQEGYVADLAPLKVGIRLAGALLEEIQEQRAEQLAGWRWGKRPANDVQAFYDELYSIAAALGFSIAQIERTYPELAPYFEAEREQYARRCEHKLEELSTLHRCRQFLRKHFSRN